MRLYWRATVPTVIGQQTPMPLAADVPSQTPTAAEVRLGVFVQAVCAVLQPAEAVPVPRALCQDPWPTRFALHEMRRYRADHRPQRGALQARSAESRPRYQGIQAVFGKPPVKVPGPCAPTRPQHAGQDHRITALRQRGPRQPGGKQLIWQQGHVHRPWRRAQSAISRTPRVGRSHAMERSSSSVICSLPLEMAFFAHSLSKR